MSRIEYVIRCKTGNYQNTRCGPAVIHTLPDDHVIAGLFCGPWHDVASAAFQKRLGECGSSATMNDAFEHVIDVIDQKWQSLTVDDRDDQGWVGTAWGAGIEMISSLVAVTWLGSNQVVHMRSGKIVNQITAHTVYDQIKQQGGDYGNSNYRRVLTKWLSREHTPEAAAWLLEPGDMVVVCSSDFAESLDGATFGDSDALAVTNTLMTRAVQQNSKADLSLLVLAADVD